MFIFFRVEESEPITPRRDRLQTPVSRLTLRVVDTVGARGSSPCFQRDSNKSARFYPTVSPMLGAEQRGLTPER